METLIWDALEEVKDPELPVVSIVEMGMVNAVNWANGAVCISLTPTFIGCPALEFIKKDIIQNISGLTGVETVEVLFCMSPPWSSQNITDTGIQKLKEFGISSFQSKHPVPSCPYCDSTDAQIESLFGPTACRSIFYCNNCKQPFEVMKKI